ncbi:MAG TPA: hypothetical protein VHD83_05020 [Puia sp.]|nr:hypothetical protein [Puia sp.]
MSVEKEFTTQESLQLISQMISKAKDDYLETGVSALMWGAIVTFCALLSFFNYLYLKWDWVYNIWFLTFLAVIPQIVIARREKKLRKYKGHDDNLMGGIWLSFAAAMFLMSYFDGRYGSPVRISMYLILYGVPTFAAGFGRRFRPMIYGGIACWVFSVLSALTDYPWQFLFLAGGAQLAWFIPGLILRKRYLKVKTQNV